MAIPSAKKSKSKPIFPDHTTSYSYFYRYAGFILFAKEVDRTSYQEIRQLYLTPAGKSYKDDFRIFVSQLKSFGRKATSDDLELIFSMVKETQSTVSAVRSATIKRTGTVAKSLRASPIVDSLSRADRDKERNEQEGKQPVGDIFHEILAAIVPAAVKEQSFVMNFLHLSRSAVSGNKSFEEFVSLADKTGWMRSLESRRPPELDKSAAKETHDVMEDLLAWLPDEIASTIEWCRTLDAL
jgi:exocyst complex component 1